MQYSLSSLTTNPTVNKNREVNLSAIPLSDSVTCQK